MQDEVIQGAVKPFFVWVAWRRIAPAWLYVEV